MQKETSTHWTIASPAKPSIRDVRSAQGFLVHAHLALSHSQRCELGDPCEAGDDVHDVDGARLRVRARGNSRAELEDDTDDVGSRVGHIRNALGDVEAAVAVGLNVALNLHVLLHGRCSAGWDELCPLSGGEHAIRGLVQTTNWRTSMDLLRLGIGEDRVDVLLKVAVRSRGRTHRGNLSEVGSEGGEVASTQSSVVHSLTTGVGCERKVGGNPTDGGEETSNTGRTAHGRVVWALQATLRSDPGQLLRLRVVEEVL